MPANASVTTTQEALLEAIVARLIAQVTAFTTKTCFITAKPLDDPSAAVRSDIFATVSPTDGSFGPEFEGGGDSQVVERAGVIVVVYSAVRLDPTQRDTAVLTHDTLGLLEYKRLVLKALAGWIPLDGSSNPLLIGEMEPLSSGAPASGWTQKNRAWADVSITFGTDFDWDVTT